MQVLEQAPNFGEGQAAQILRYLYNGNRIRAIKLMRRLDNSLSLVEAKEVIYRICGKSEISDLEDEVRKLRSSLKSIRLEVSFALDEEEN